MVQLTDIHSLSDFQRNTKAHLQRLKRSGRPEVLTVNGKAEVVVQDARSYQRLLARAAEVEAVGILRERLKAMGGERRGDRLKTPLRTSAGSTRAHGSAGEVWRRHHARGRGRA